MHAAHGDHNAVGLVQLARWRCWDRAGIVLGAIKISEITTAHPQLHQMGQYYSGLLVVVKYYGSCTLLDFTQPESRAGRVSDFG